MPFSFGFYHDAALTQPIDASNKLTATQAAGGGLGPVDKTIYFGSTATGMQAQDEASPGVTAISVSVADADAGTGAPATEFKLALSSAGLDTAVAGAALALSHTVLSGVANAVPIYTRRTSAIAVAGSYTDISLTAQSLIETPV